MKYIGLHEKLSGLEPSDFIGIAPYETIRRSLLLGPEYGLVDGKYEVSLRLTLNVVVDSITRNSTIITSYLTPPPITLMVHGWVYRAPWESETSSSTTSPSGSGLLGATSVSFTDCSSSQQSTIYDAIARAKNHAQSVINYMNNYCDSTYVTYMGSYASATSRWTTVKNGYVNALSRLNNYFSFDCMPNSCRDPPNWAYVYPGDYSNHKIYLCGKFWLSPQEDGWDTKWGVVLHELSHFDDIRGTEDHTYGLSSCRTLAATNPSYAIDNADNYEYFAEVEPHCP